MIKLIFVFVCLLNLFSCKKDGIYKDHYNNGKVKSISIYKKGLHIHQKDFYQNGNTKHIESYLIIKKDDGSKLLTHFKTKDWYRNGFISRVIIENPITYKTIYSAYWDTLGRKNGQWKWICNNKYYAIEKYKKGKLFSSFTLDFKNKLKKEYFVNCEKPKALKKICKLQEQKRKKHIN